MRTTPIAAGHKFANGVRCCKKERETERSKDRRGKKTTTVGLVHTIGPYVAISFSFMHLGVKP